MTGSMTGFGRCQRVINGRTITVELKSVNHRYFELNARTPRGCLYMEERLKTLVSQSVSRGKVDLFLTIVSDAATDIVVKASPALAGSYLAAIGEIAEATGLANDVTLSSLLRFPDLFSLQKQDIDEEQLWSDVRAVAEEAVAGFVTMRRQEGERLAADLLSRLDTVVALCGQIEQQSVETVSAYRARLLQKITELLADRNVEESRVLTEVAIFSERVAVDEETVRLRSHVEQFRHILSQDEPAGRKLDFLTQELNREANTIGSKSQSAEAAKIVVELKSEIEKIREQIQNLE